MMQENSQIIRRMEQLLNDNFARFEREQQYEDLKAERSRIQRERRRELQLLAEDRKGMWSIDSQEHHGPY